MTKKTKLPKLKTPVGIAVYPRLDKPDTQFDDDGIYSVRLRFDPKVEEHKAFLDSLDELFDAGVQTMVEEHELKKGKYKLSDKPFKPETDRDSGDETGFVLVNFKMKASGVRKDTEEAWTQRPALFDAHGKPCPGAKVGGGSKLRIAFQAMPFYTKLAGAGISLRLCAVKIIDLVEWTGAGTAESFGFGDEEDGFVAGDELKKAEEASDDEGEVESKPKAAAKKGAKKSGADEDSDF